MALLLGAACGKKGPPLAPLVPIPAAVELIEATRLGGDVYVTLTIPVENVDKHTPADLGRIDIYGYTGRTAPSRARWVELATLVATVPVAPPPLPEGEQPEAAETPEAATELASSRKAAFPTQGGRISVRDTLTSEELVQGKEAPAVPTVGPPAKPVERRSRAPEPPLKRFYTAVPFNPKGRPGPPGGVAEFPLLPAPDPPSSLGAHYTDRAITLAWEPSGGVIGFLLERVLPEEPTPFLPIEEGEVADAVVPLSPPTYHVYREILPDAASPPGSGAAPWREEPPAPLTAAPVATLQFSDSVEFGRRRCYTVRAVRGVPPDARVGDASPEACFTAVDVFPPAPPQALAAVASEGAISLIWEPNGDLDLAGYIVLRGQPADDTLHPLTAAPVAEAAFRDETVAPGVRYVYAVIAVDNRMPLPNVSLESARVEETAR